ncbi:RND family efflux transporter MFP subunit [Hyphomicrobium denitrificans 1NES1]|uniref:RND family efflux transporter MFP subunit n=1 Tax=Hyphomicrobium denitrificans 1NES1 TaxID=670307 RepID=N0B6D2_9HYPH|nr:efflux RND transporter periplasmic adaptor subunit [Hyphomicrobium denitrificans]AGK59139.1 RND family efflux transporter MFP subunit [Hyphomicrobium denitrificans 1NES1]
MTTNELSRSPLRRHSIALFSALAAGVLLGSGITAAHAQGAPPAFPVTVAPPLAEHIKTWDEYPGRFEAFQRVELRPRVSGYVDQVNFKEGSDVKVGDLLFTLDKRPFEIAVEAAKAEVARANAQVEFAKADLQRAAPLVESKALSEQVYEQRKSTLGVAEAQEMAAAAQLKAAELNLEWAEVRAPISGRISDKKIDVGNLVIGGQVNATLMATIVSIDPIHFVFDTSEADYLRYQRLNQSGQRMSSRDTPNPVRIKLADESDWTHEGTMDFIDNAFNEHSGTLRGRAIVPNRDGLLTPGIFARLALYAGDIDALLVPDDAIVSDQAHKIVYTVNADDVIVATPVKLGQIYEGLRVIKSGLKANDRVVIEGVANPAIRPGTKVAPTTGTIKAPEKTAQK